MKVSGNLRLDHGDREALLGEGAIDTLMTFDKDPGVLTDKGKDDAYRYFNSLKGIGQGSRITVEANPTNVLGYGWVLQVKV